MDKWPYSAGVSQPYSARHRWTLRQPAYGSSSPSSGPVYTSSWAIELCESDPAAIQLQNEVDRPSIAAAVITDHGQRAAGSPAIPEGDLAWQFPVGKVEEG
jgi:hypothetical protein